MNETKSLYNHELNQARDSCGVTKEDMENTFNKIRETLISSDKTSQFVEKMEEYFQEGDARKKLLCILLGLPKMMSDAIKLLVLASAMEELRKAVGGFDEKFL